mgnify:CR=1 FL=1
MLLSGTVFVSLLLAAMVVHRAVTIPGYRVAVVAPALKQSAELLKRVKEFLAALHQLQSEFPAGMKVAFRPWV